MVQPSSILQAAAGSPSSPALKLAGPAAKEHRKGRPVSMVEYVQQQ